MPPSHTDQAGPKPAHATVDLESLLGDSDAELVYEGLHRLRELKVEALQLVQTEGVALPGRSFEPWDFGIAQIDRLLARLGAGPSEESVSTQEH
ncbi:hypothetical protein AcdelDRAFT_0268 [Acidovorax delafieldii 2AN]|uniref:Uncharacterized protein n=1 Tax=Acidovorax delafieldii 2AN TaxID=573060 RepID=C5T038_ACIDE|nr:hypothetical protein [Acidovorax delafieldii]EER62146.1 hypothetical protein AcdelDRAFT_0268 [Acidovorax delafieldii 2AN]